TCSRYRMSKTADKRVGKRCNRPSQPDRSGTRCNACRKLWPGWNDKGERSWPELLNYSVKVAGGMAYGLRHRNGIDDKQYRFGFRPSFYDKQSIDRRLTKRIDSEAIRRVRRESNDAASAKERYNFIVGCIVQCFSAKHLHARIVLRFFNGNWQTQSEACG